MLSAETRIVSKRKLLFDNDKQYVAIYSNLFCSGILLWDFQSKLFDFKKPQHYFVYLLQSCLNMYKNAKMREHFFYFLPKFTKPPLCFAGWLCNCCLRFSEARYVKKNNWKWQSLYIFWRSIVTQKRSIYLVSSF